MKLKQLFFSRRPAALPLYEAIVAAARQPFLYGPQGAPDTVEGRLGMIVLHLAIAFRRLKQSGRKREAQQLVEAFFADVEGNLRESGVSDVAIPKRMREIEALYVQQMESFDAGLPKSPANLNSEYAAQLAARLAELPLDDIIAGRGWMT